jgi:hypothetical protein
MTIQQHYAVSVIPGAAVVNLCNGPILLSVLLLMIQIRSALLVWFPNRFN